MTIVLDNPNARFFGLTGTQPVGQRQVATATDYTGAVTTLTRINQSYWSVTTRAAKDAFRRPAIGATVCIWRGADGRYVVDYMVNSAPVQVGTARSLGAAIGLAVTSTTDRWAKHYA